MRYPLAAALSCCLSLGSLLASGCGLEPAGILDEAAEGEALSRSRLLARSAPAGPRSFTPHTASPLDGRPYQLKVPRGYDPSKPTPLVVMLHGFTFSGPLEELYMNLGALAESRTFLYAYPDGTKDKLGLRFWNATDYCCDLWKSGVDDVAYVTAVIDDMSKKYNVDTKRVFLVGHSNGGFMSHRMACELSPRIAGIVSLAGAQWKNPAKCTPSQPVAVLQLHGTSDAIVGYAGGLGYPSARDSVATWASKNGCTGSLETGAPLDLDGGIAGSETTVQAYGGCPMSGAVELWSIQGGSHMPGFRPTWTGAIYDFLMAHPKP
jgi:polyhydroxybutyrate depolymerase